jgi:hypothetical protein
MQLVLTCTIFTSRYHSLLSVKSAVVVFCYAVEARGGVVGRILTHSNCCSVSHKPNNNKPI